MTYVVDTNPARILEAFGHDYSLNHLGALGLFCAAFVVVTFVKVFTKGF